MVKMTIHAKFAMKIISLGLVVALKKNALATLINVDLFSLADAPVENKWDEEVCFKCEKNLYQSKKDAWKTSKCIRCMHISVAIRMV